MPWETFLHGQPEGWFGGGRIEQVAWEEGSDQVVAALFSAYQRPGCGQCPDFADLIYYTYRLLKKRKTWRSGAKVPLYPADELQDTNRAQFALLKP